MIRVNFAESLICPISAGDKLGPYEILTQIGAGGMGEVYKARDTRLDRIVALKVSKTEFSERFELEARAIAALNHPHICQLYDVGPNYLVMELIEGVPLKGPLPLDQALKCAVQICDALAAAHKKGITHRDLKPANILVTKAGVKLLDFGLAKIGQAAKPPSDATLTMALTGNNEIVGTLYYMSPEQLQAATGQEIDARSDIFSFGLVLYEMLTGKRAFEGSSPASVIAAIIERPAPSIADVAPPALDHALKTCLAKDPEERWQTARDLKHALEWIATASPEATPVSARGTRHALLPWLAAGVLAIVAASASWIAWRATRPVEKPLMRLSVDLGPDALTGTVAISPDGTRIVFPMRGADGKQQLATRLLDQPTAAVLSGTQGGTEPFFSPDGQWAGFFADGKLKKISVLGGTAVTLCNAAFTSGGSWGENGAIIAGISTGPLVQVPAAGGTPQQVTKLDKGEVIHLWPQILPGGSAVLFTASASPVAFEDASIKVLSLKTGETKTLVQGGYFDRYIPSAGTGGHLLYMHEGVLFGVAFDSGRLELGGAPVPILADVVGYPGFSQSGTLVYQSGKSLDQTWPIVWLDSSGKTKPLVTQAGQYDQPRLSPDGGRLAMAVESAKGLDIYVYDWQRNTMTRLTTTGKFTGGFVWTPDGKYLICSSGTDIFRVRADGADDPQRFLENATEANAVLYSFSPGGQHLAYFASTPETGYDIWTLPFDTSDPKHPKPGKPEPFLRTSFNELEPVFSPDGRWIAYRSDESGPMELYVRPFPGPGGKWQISSEGVQHPRWSPDGRQLFYETLDNHITVVDYTAKGDSFIAGKPRLWSPTQILAPSGAFNYDIAPDGKRLAVFPMPESKADKGSVHVTFLLNFSDELRRRVPVTQ